MSKEIRYFTCSFDDCESSFRRLDRLKSHENLHTSECPFVCSFEDCDKSYSKHQHLKRHEETHKSNLFRCSKVNCDQVFETKHYLLNHEYKVHHKKKTYKCSYCDEQFNKQCWLKAHEATHTGVKPYLCTHDGCEKRFMCPSRLKRHLKVHEGHTCNKPNCNEHFSKWTLYRKHMKVAHPENFRCNICEKQFSTFNNLVAHKNMHEFEREVFECPKPNCSRFYFAKRNLTYHIKSYHEERPFVCSGKDCHKTFKTEVDMNKHFRNQHDPNKRLRRKKKKTKSKPTFTAKLAGCVQENKQKDENKSEVKDVVTPVSEECLNIQVEENRDEITASSDEEYSKKHKVDDDIQNLLNMIEVRNAVNGNKTFDKFVSFKEFVKL